jgi:putative hydrolase of the HAD superfamily
LTDNHNIEAIIFDLGNVLIDFDHRIAARRIAYFTNRSAEEIFGLFFDSQLTGLFEEGKISPQEFFSEIKEALNLKLTYDSFVPIWNEIFFLSEKNRAVYHLARELKERYKLVLLSNINILHFDYLKRKFPVFDPFHKIVASYEVGFKKPHPLIYRKIIDILQVSPESIFYTDDRQELIEGANQLGIQGFVFKDVEKLKKDLSDKGII